MRDASPLDDFTHLKAKFFVDCNVARILRFEEYRHILAYLVEHLFKFALSSALFDYADIFDIAVGLRIVILLRDGICHFDVLLCDFCLFDTDVEEKRQIEKGFANAFLSSISVSEGVLIEHKARKSPSL